MATGDKEQVLVALEGEMSDLKDLIELAMAMTADNDEWSVTLIRAPIVHICRSVIVGPHCQPDWASSFGWS
jgi:hypothetical protein